MDARGFIYEEHRRFFGVVNEGLEELAGAELERLPTDARRLLRAASVFGGSFAVPAVLALLGPEDRRHGVGGVLQLLVERGIISEQGDFDGTVFGFRHALYQQAAYAMLTKRDRQLGHRLAARYLQRAGQPNAMLIAGLVSAPVVLATGAVLLGLGAKRHVASKRYAVTPSIGPGTAGLQLQGRF